ncbi:response regulator transcription factor [Streptomyces sp. NPDC002889]|uniref:response regulator transcription factor n=1 Tax=Streptomyces sp. NPDC002889 TaxID=3364669 RepID=UPI00369FAEE4
MRVLVVDSDDEAAELLAARLARSGHQVSRARTGLTALHAWRQADLVLLDLGLPDLDGVEVCGEIRAKSSTPVITFTAGDTELDRVLSLQAGADDCLVKPYGFRELAARMDAVMRRAHSRTSVSTVSRGALHIDPRSRQVRVGERIIDVTRKEFDLLHLLASLPETVVSRKDLMSKVWADESAVSTRTIDTHVSTLRSKLGDGDWIVTVRGVGYRLGDGTEN